MARKKREREAPDRKPAEHFFREFDQGGGYIPSLSAAEQRELSIRDTMRIMGWSRERAEALQDLPEGGSSPARPASRPDCLAPAGEDR